MVSTAYYLRGNLQHISVLYIVQEHIFSYAVIYLVSILPLISSFTNHFASVIASVPCTSNKNCYFQVLYFWHFYRRVLIFIEHFTLPVFIYCLQKQESTLIIFFLLSYVNVILLCGICHVTANLFKVLIFTIPYIIKPNSTGWIARQKWEICTCLSSRNLHYHYWLNQYFVFRSLQGKKNYIIILILQNFPAKIHVRYLHVKNST